MLTPPLTDHYFPGRNNRLFSPCHLWMGKAEARNLEANLRGCSVESSKCQCEGFDSLSRGRGSRLPASPGRAGRLGSAKGQLVRSSRRWWELGLAEETCDLF